jgi:hypothetical protein
MAIGNIWVSERLQVVALDILSLYFLTYLCPFPDVMAGSGIPRKAEHTPPLILQVWFFGQLL